MPLTGSFTNLLLRGLLAGLLAGIVTGGVATILGERHIDSAIAIEEAAAPPEEPGHVHEEGVVVSRDMQKVGLILATSLAGLAIGAIFAVVAHYARQSSGVRGSALVLAMAGLGWLAIGIVPFLKYPANPPAVGNTETIDQRTVLWLAAVLLGLVAVTVALYAARVVRRQRFLSVRVAAPLVSFILVVAVGYLVLPTINEVGETFPATLLWDFRLASLATQATMWVALGLLFAFLSERAASRTSSMDGSPVYR